MALQREHWISPEEYLAIDRASTDIKYEYIDGHMYAMSGGTRAHAVIAYNMANLLDSHLANGPCRFFQSDVKVRVTEKKYFYPDVTVSCSPEDIPDQEDIVYFPKLIVEVLSPGTEVFDRGKKFLYYQQVQSIQEYVLISTEYQKVEIYQRQQDGGKWTYQQFGQGQEVELASIGLTFPITALYRRTQVPEYEEA